MNKFNIKKFLCMNTTKVPTKILPNQATDMRDMVAKAGLLRTRDGILKYNTVGFGSAITGLFGYQPRFKTAPVTISVSGGNISAGLPEFEGYTKITNCEELQAMQDDLAGNYKLANDIDCTYCTQNPAGALYNAGAGFEPIGTFIGIFDGNGHTITGLFINRPSTAWVGLFKKTDTGAEIKNVGLIDSNIIGERQVGSLVGVNWHTPISKCYSTGVVNGSNSNYDIGGLIGHKNSSTITDCYSNCSVSGDHAIGGLIGKMINSPTATNCYSTGAVSGVSILGGLIGSGWVTDTYNDCFWDTQTSGQATSDGGTGKTTAQMKQEATFTNWDFSTIWAIVEDTSYPTLR